MDIKLRSNGIKPEADKTIAEEIAFFEEEPAEKPRKRVRANSMLLLIAAVFTTLFCITGAVEINSYGRPARLRVMTKFQQILTDNRGTSYQLRDELTRYEKNLQRFFIHYDSFNPEIFNKASAATDDEIEILKIEREIMFQQAVREIMDMYNTRISEAENALSNETVTEAELVYTPLPDGTASLRITPTQTIIPEVYNEYSSLIAERDKMVSEAREKYLLSDEQAAEIVEQNKQESSVYNASNFYEIKAYLESTSYFQYCLKSAKTGDYYSSLPMNIQESDAYKMNPLQYVEENTDYFISVQDAFFSTYFNNTPLNESFKSVGLSGYIFIPESYGTNNPVADYFSDKQFANSFYRGLLIMVLTSCVIAALIWFLFIKSDKRGVINAKAAAMKLYSKLPFVLKGSLFLGAGFCIAVYSSMYSRLYYSVYDRGILAAAIPLKLYLLAATAAVLYILLCLCHLWAFIKKPSIILNEPELKFIGAFFKNVVLVYKQNVFSVSLSLTFLIMAYVFVQLVMFFLVVVGRFYVPVPAFIILELIINLLALYVFGLIVALAKTNRYMDAIIAGDLEIEINERGFYRGVINKLNRLRGGVRRVVVEKNKSEKMKTDLITNVSHDLKTPLTSIINYIELLKSPQISDSDKAEYIDILDRKALRVKHLIDDLFEATKLSSGQITLQKEQINAVNLLKQAVGEVEEKLVSAEILLKLTYSNENVPLMADGKKLWRVFENLFTNMINYAQPGTRAYVDITTGGGNCEIVFKNISFYEMNFEYSELFERFRRGDAARSTEGSGLGLSIAKDIIELHGGTMEILIDGDLFKVIIRLPAV